MIVWVTLVLNNHYEFVYTVESLIAAYYLFTAMAIGTGRNNALLLSTGIAACMLSRYSIVFWVPLCIGCYYIAGRKKEAVSIIMFLLMAFIIIYWLPFLRKDPSIFFKGYAYHTSAALEEWKRNNECTGLGFASWAARFLPGDLAKKLSIYQKLHLVLCVLTVAGLFLCYYKFRIRYALNDYLLFSFKIHLTVFYSFIQIPYRYLFFVPLIVSSVLLAEGFQKKRLHNYNAMIVS